jgi:hypothetical protein
MRTPGTGTERVHLPFEGEGTPSIILSKTFILAHEAKITDSAITSGWPGDDDFPADRSGGGVAECDAHAIPPSSKNFLPLLSV